MDDARVDDEMTIKDLAKELRTFREHVDSGFASVDRKFESMDQKFDAMDQKFDAMDQKFESKLGGVESKVGGVESKLDSLDARMRIGFEETHRLIKMGFENVQILDEKIDRRFNETERQHADHRTLLEAGIRDVRRDLPPRTTPVPRPRRRSRD